MIAMARFAVVSALVFASGGCAQLFGISETTGPDGQQQDLVTLDITRVSIGASVVTGPQDITINSATFYATDPGDPTSISETVATEAGNEWSAPVDGTPSVVFTLPDYPMTLDHVMSLPSRAQTYGFEFYGHPNSQPPADAATLTLQATLPTPFAATESLMFMAAGTWTQYSLPASGLPAVGTTAVNTTFNYADTVNPYAGLPLQKFTTADALLLLRYDNNALTAVGTATPMDQSDTSSTLVFGSLSAYAPTTTVAVPLDPSMDAARFAAQMPVGTSTGLSWRVNAAPGSGYAIGPVLQQGNATEADTMIPMSYANPFATTQSWTAYLTAYDTATRAFTPATPALPVTLYSQVVQVVAADANASISFPAAMPATITLAGVPLTSDGVTVALDSTQPVSVSVTTDLTTTTLYQVHLYALVSNTAGTALQYQEVFNASSDQPDFTFPPELFADGTYTLRVVCFAGGFPNAEVGDLTMHPFPFSYGLLDSGVFTVSH